MISKKDLEKGVIIYQLKEDDVVFDLRSRGWCGLPYPGHPKGCPNYKKREICPPKSPLIQDIVSPPFKLVAVKFDLGAHVERMKNKHPNWSDRQSRCVLYWQRGLDKKLKDLCETVASEMPDSIVLYKPESNGVNLFRTCKNIGLILERNPKDTVWKMAIIGKVILNHISKEL